MKYISWQNILMTHYRMSADLSLACIFLPETSPKYSSTLISGSMSSEWISLQPTCECVFIAICLENSEPQWLWPLFSVPLIQEMESRIMIPQKTSPLQWSNELEMCLQKFRWHVLVINQLELCYSERETLKCQLLYIACKRPLFFKIYVITGQETVTVRLIVKVRCSPLKYP